MILENLIFDWKLIFSLLVWFTTLVGVLLVSFWLVEIIFLRSGSLKQADYGPEEVHVRILTVDDVETVRETIEKLDNSLDDIHVICEEPMDLDVNVHVVPESFRCKAESKGRALEWANRNLHTDREFVLYLDEDSHMEDFSGLPDRDIVQLREKPRYTGSMLSYIADVFRMGVQLEQLAFPNMRLPLFAWGGGIAVRREVEKNINWNRNSLVEDTAFAWRAVSNGASFGVSDIYVRNEAPPSIMAMVEQRRRWSGGNHIEAKHLSQPYRTLQEWRNFSWGFTPVSALVLPLMLFLFSTPIFYQDALQVIGSFLFVVTPLWYILGIIYYRTPDWKYIPGLIICYPATLLHGLGAAWGIISPPRDFEVTPKEKS